MAMRAESGQITTVAPMVTMQMGMEGTVLRRSGILGRQSSGGSSPELEGRHDGIRPLFPYPWIPWDYHVLT